jgi:hypothetical protein
MERIKYRLLGKGFHRMRSELRLENNRFSKRSKALLSTALVALLTVSMLAFALPIVNAQVTMDIPTNCFIAVSPNPSGVKQTMNIVFWLDHDPPQLNSVDYYGWNYTVTIITPDGKTVTKGPYESDSVGGAYCLYTPDKTGEYRITANFIEAKITVTGSVGLMTLPKGTYTFKGDSSREVTLTVTEEQVVPWPEIPVPSTYWSNPISAENRDWYKLTGNWLSSSPPANYYTLAPESSHLLWTKQLTFGGITGGLSNIDTGSAPWGINFYHGLLYENKFSPRIISGRLYYNTFASGVKGVTCVDIRTGQTLWSNDSMPQLSAAQVLTFNSGVQTGSMAYLWTSSLGAWQMYDAFTGILLANFTGASGSPSSVFGENGEMLVYTLSGSANTLRKWNSTLAVTYGTTQFNQMTYRPWSVSSGTINWTRGVQWTVSVPDVPGTQASCYIDYPSRMMIAEATITSNTTSPTFVHVGYNLDDGSQVWIRNWTNVGWGPGGPSSPTLISSWARASGLGTYAFFQKETMQYHVIDLKTGIERFVTEPLNIYTDSDWSVYDWGVNMLNGMLLCDGYSGDVVAFNLTTGAYMWTFKQPSSGLQTPYGVWPTFGGVTYADNKIYFGVTEHTPNTPMMRGYTIYCMDAKTGQQIWKLPCFFASIAIADGIMVGYNAYDNQIYGFGKGLSEVTVDAPMSGVTIGSPIAIRGTVTDQSPGKTAVGVPAAGTPAISDDNMTAWMSYLYLQQPQPTTVSGVPVTLYVSSTDGAIVDTLQTTSDASGVFVTSWTPNTEGVFKINAVFDGSRSYYGSSGETGIAVGKAVAAPASPTVAPTTEAPTATVAPTTVAPTTVAPQPEESFNAAVYVSIGAVVLIVVVAAIAVFLRRRK